MFLSIVLLAAASACAQPESADPDWIGGRETYATCAACHGKAGEGGVGPALSTVRETFPDCGEHKKWISLGSVRWKEQVGETYGANASAVKGAMPAFNDLTDRQLGQIAMYERVRFGGADQEAESAACGLG